MVAINRATGSGQALDLTKRSRLRWVSDAEATLLFATDLSETSRAGLHWATELAKLCRARILMLHVQPPPDGDESLIFHNPSRSRSRASTELRGFLPTDPTVEATYRVVLGDPAEQILTFAEQEKVSLIVIGNHQRRGLQRLLKGSVTETVLRRAACPVFVFRQEIVKPG